MGATPAIRARHLWHRYGSKQVLHDVTFDVGQGEIFGFIGPNGAGKTTTIRIMATLMEPLAGRVEIDGLDVTMAPEEVRRIIGYMPDHAGVYDRITVREYLEFFADAYRIPSLSVVDAVVELTDIGPLQNQLVVTLSKGQKQRLQLARILVHDPKVLILDEPASDLDPRARIEIRDLLLDLQSLGKTILLSSHILTELSDVCSSIGIIERGRMVVYGPIGEIAQRLDQHQSGAQHAQQQWQAPPGADPAAQQAQQPPPMPVAAMPPRRAVKLRVLGDPRAAAQVLSGGPGITDIELSGNALMVGYNGGDQLVAQIVSHLVHRNIGVVGVEQERNELERIFLQATAHSAHGAHGPHGGHGPGGGHGHGPRGGGRR